MKSVSTNFRFKAEFHQRIKEAASESGSTLTGWVVTACLEKMKRDERAGCRR